MLGRKLAFITAFFVFVTICQSAYAKITVPEPESHVILSVVPGATSYKRIKKPVDHYLLSDTEGKTIGVAMITSRIPPEVTGYQNEIALLVGINKKGEIAGVKLLAHEDSPEHVNLITSKGFLNKFLKKKPLDKWDDIETVTGATISSEAMLKDIHSASQEIVNKVVKKGILSRIKEKRFMIGSVINRPIITSIAIVLLIGLSLTAAYLPKRRILKTITLFLSFIFIGLLFNLPITIGNFIDIGYGIIPGVTNLALLILMIYAITSALLKGPLYCIYLCPFGAIQEGASALRVPKIDVDHRWIKRARLIRWIILMTVILAVVGFNAKAFRNTEPFSLCYSPAVTLAVLIQVGIILIASLFFRRPWCRLFCPTGFLLELLSKLGAKIRYKLFSDQKSVQEVS